MTVLVCPNCRAQLDLRYGFSLTLAAEGSWRNLPLKEMELSVRAHNCLHNMGVETAGDIEKFSDGDLLRTPNFGQRSLREIREEIARLKAQEASR